MLNRIDRFLPRAFRRSSPVVAPAATAMPTALNGRPRLRGEAIGVAHSSPLPPRIDLVAVAEGGARLVLEAGSLRPISHSVVRLAVINGGWEIGSWMGFSIVEDELRGRYALFRAYGACKPIAVLSEIAAGWDLAGRAAIYLPEEVFSRLIEYLRGFSGSAIEQKSVRLNIAAPFDPGVSRSEHDTGIWRWHAGSRPNKVFALIA
jgi:hypothetical protein